MIGNDLVDLQEASHQSNWKRKGYLSKIFSIEERKQILSNENPENLIWLFWSMKEAAYKIDSRLTGLRNFAPSSLLCQNLNKTTTIASGKVTVNRKSYFTSSDLQDTYIHTIAAQTIGALAQIRKEIYVFPETCFDYKSRNPACVSHHGRYLALVF